MKFSKLNVNETIAYLALLLLITIELVKSFAFTFIFYRFPSIGLIKLYDLFHLIIKIIQSILFILFIAFAADILESQKKYSPSENILDDEP